MFLDLDFFLDLEFLLFLVRIEYKVFRNKNILTGRINHILHFGISFEFFHSFKFIFSKFEKTSSGELVCQINTLVPLLFLCV
jgi:hypothetical protein